ncbi:MAG: outer membrane protein assembly factor BamD [Desulfobacterales bacterium]
MMKRFLLLIIIICLTCSGCSLLGHFFKAEEDESDTFLAWDGMEKYEEGDYKGAKAAFEKIKDWYPYSKFAMLAELKVADAHFKLGEYEEAIFAYEEFENLHPRNEAMPYVVFQIGRCYFARIDSPDRDQEMAKRARDTFIRLMTTYPEDEYTVKAREYYNKTLKSLAESEFNIGLFYYRSKHYRAALNRFRSVIEKYPDVGVHQKALDYIALTEAQIGEVQ